MSLQPQLRPKSVLSSDDLDNSLKGLEERTAAGIGPQKIMEALLELEALEQTLDWCSPQPEPRMRCRQTRMLFETQLYEWVIHFLQQVGGNQDASPAPVRPEPAPISIPIQPARPGPFESAPIPVSPHVAGNGGWETRLPRNGSMNEFARILGIAATTLRKWTKEGMPATKGRKGRFKMVREPVVQWLKDNNKIF